MTAMRARLTARYLVVTLALCLAALTQACGSESSGVGIGVRQSNAVWGGGSSPRIFVGGPSWP